MILEKQTEANIQQDGETQESIGMSLDLDSAQVLMQMLSKNLYSDDIGSTVRECASNALDSHRRAGTDKPIIVSLRANKDNNFEFSVEDFGTGLDADDVKNIISKYGKSTKRNSATELGMMGLGFKAPLAYTSSFYFTCRKNGVERKYMMYEGEDVNTIDLLYEAPTDQPDGVKVIVPVKYGDKYNFNRKIKEQLAYFDSVYFDVEGIDNDFTITRHEHFQFSELASNNYLHICLDNVYYPIDFDKLGISTIYLPIGLRFSLTDGIFPTPNRESIRYTKEAKEVIIKRLGDAANYFIEKYNETIRDSDDIKAIVNYYLDGNRELKYNTMRVNIGELAKYATTKVASPKLNGIQLLDIQRVVKIQEYILGEYEAKFMVTRKAMRDAKHSWQPTSLRRINDTVYVYNSDRVPQMKKDYIKSITPDGYSSDSEASIFRKVKSFKLFGNKGTSQNYDNYYTMLELRNYPKSQWRTLIQEFQLIIKSLTKDFIDIDKMVVPQDFIDSRKKKKVSASRISNNTTPGVRRVKLKGEMVCKQAEKLERWIDGKNCKWVSKTYDMATFHRNPFILVYGKQEDADQMDKWYSASRKKHHHLEFAILSERETKLVEKVQLHNLIPFSKFMEGKTKPFERIATECLIDRLYDQYRSAFNNYEVIEGISTDLFNKFDELYKYRNKMSDMHNDVRDVIIEHATKINAFDLVIYPTFKEVESILIRLPFINAMLGNINRYRGDVDNNNPMVVAFTDLFKYHKYRIDWKKYNIRLNEDLPLEETLTTETVEELVNQD